MSCDAICDYIDPRTLKCMLEEHENATGALVMTCAILIGREVFNKTEIQVFNEDVQT